MSSQEKEASNTFLPGGLRRPQAEVLGPGVTVTRVKLLRVLRVPCQMGSSALSLVSVYRSLCSWGWAQRHCCSSEVLCVAVDAASPAACLGNVRSLWLHARV